MVICSLKHLGYNTALFFCISARRCCLSLAIEAEVSDAFLWMQSGHAQDVAAKTVSVCAMCDQGNSTRSG
jgi:hypothetical protein